MATRAPTFASLLLVSSLLPLVAGCGVKERIEQKVQEKVAEKVLEVASAGEVDIDSKDGEVTIEGQDGSKVHVDGEDGKVVVTDAEGKTHVYEQTGEDSAKVTNSEGLEAEFAAKIPEGFPLPLPPLREVVAGHRMETPDKIQMYSLNAIASGQDIEATAAFMTKQFEAQGLTVEATSLATGEGRLKTLAAKNEDQTIEASAMLSLDTTDDAKPGVIMVISWSDKRAQTAG